ncbi:MAG: multicopper oxidase family protein [Pseudomonadota bacterium]|nr:multicopper oxidase family protein [Pseudomonadota bacterium]
MTGLLPSIQRVLYAPPLWAAVSLVMSAAVLWIIPCWYVAPPLHRMMEFTSENGVLTATLEAKEERVRLGEVTIDGSIYNGEYAGPVLRVHPGDVMKIRLINHLSRTTNIHYHGIETSPLGNSDNIHVAVKPGETFDYEIKIPLTQPPGLYWYHDHTHGISDQNVMGGLSGTLVVEGFAQQFPELAGVREQLFVLKDYQFEDSQDPLIAKTYHNLVQTINGQTMSTIRIRPGETQLWRFSNQSSGRYFHLSLKGHKFRILGDDGRTARKETDVDVLDIKPAQRLDVLVDGGASGEYAMVSEKVLTGNGSSRTLARLEVSGSEGKTIGEIAAFPQRPDLRNAKIDERRTIVFSQLNDDKNYFVNGRKFDAGRIDLRIPLGNVEEWTIKNDSDDMHVFHIHQIGFQVTEINGVPQPYNGYVDNVRVPERGEVKAIMPFTDPVIVGQFVMHCHVLKHEDNGMMAHVEIYDPNPDGLFPFYRGGRNICTRPGQGETPPAK